MKKKIKIIDSIMGSGKTTKAIEKMKNLELPFIYVTPFLDEVERVLTAVPNTYQPDTDVVYNCDGSVKIINKRDSLISLASQKKNIITTHSLFQSLNKGDYMFFEDYYLILDEVVTPINIIDITTHDLDIALRDGLLTVNKKNNQVAFTSEDYNGKFYNNLKPLCDSTNVYLVQDRCLVWTFPVEIFKAFLKVDVLTYMFKSSMLYYYFKYNGFDMEFECIDREEESAVIDKVNSILYIYNGKCNEIGEHRTSFSLNYIKKLSKKSCNTISISVSNLLTRHFKTNATDVAFTTFKDAKDKLGGKGYKSSFIPVNERATNKYSEKKTMVYLANRYLNPVLVDFLRSKGVEFNQDEWALSELVQWVWRGSIRNQEPMSLFIPSKRMRNLLENWMNQTSLNA